jgi:hypothetical protein
MRMLHLRPLAAGAVCALVASCTSDLPTFAPDRLPAYSIGHSDRKVEVCHRPGTDSQVLEIAAAAVPAHLAHGDYITTLRVSHEPDEPADGAHFVTIGDAISAARASRMGAEEMTAGACRITIVVPAGTYAGATGRASGTLEHFPLVVDVPDITLHGALAMALDDAGRATGLGASADESVLTPVAPLPIAGGVSTPIIIVNAHPGGFAGNGLTVQGFVFQSGHDPLVDAGGQAILSLRATGLTIRGNRIESGFTESLDLRVGSAAVVQNHLAGTVGTCDVCLAGPGAFSAVGNRLLSGGIPGIAASPTVLLPVPPEVEQYLLPATAETWADIRNNEVRDHRRVPVGVGIRMDAVGIGAVNVHGVIHAVVQDNALVNNRFGIMVHGAFAAAGTDRRGDVDLTLGGNVFQGSCETNLFVSLARHQTGLGLQNTPYLLNSTFRVTLSGDVRLDDVWYSHKAGFGNSLVVDGNVIPNGQRQFYSATGCPGK